MLEGEDYTWYEADDGWYDLMEKNKLGWQATYALDDEQTPEVWIVMRAYGNFGGKTEFVLKSEMPEPKLRERLVMEWLLLRGES